MVDLQYGWARKQFSLAVRELATGEGDVRERVADVYLGPLLALTLSPQALPDELQKDWGFVETEMTKRGNNDEELVERYGVIRARQRRITKRKAAEVAEVIVRIAERLDSEEPG